MGDTRFGGQTYSANVSLLASPVTWLGPTMNSKAIFLAVCLFAFLLATGTACLSTGIASAQAPAPNVPAAAPNPQARAPRGEGPSPAIADPATRFVSQMAVKGSPTYAPNLPKRSKRYVITDFGAVGDGK